MVLGPDKMVRALMGEMKMENLTQNEKMKKDIYTIKAAALNMGVEISRSTAEKILSQAAKDTKRGQLTMLQAKNAIENWKVFLANNNKPAVLWPIKKTKKQIERENLMMNIHKAIESKNFSDSKSRIFTVGEYVEITFFEKDFKNKKQWEKFLTLVKITKRDFDYVQVTFKLSDIFKLSTVCYGD